MVVRGQVSSLFHMWNSPKTPAHIACQAWQQVLLPTRDLSSPNSLLSKHNNLFVLYY